MQTTEAKRVCLGFWNNKVVFDRVALCCHLLNAPKQLFSMFLIKTIDQLSANILCFQRVLRFWRFLTVSKGQKKLVSFWQFLTLSHQKYRQKPNPPRCLFGCLVFNLQQNKMMCQLLLWSNVWNWEKEDMNHQSSTHGTGATVAKMWRPWWEGNVTLMSFCHFNLWRLYIKNSILLRI